MMLKMKLVGACVATAFSVGAVALASQGPSTIDVGDGPVASATFAGGCFWCMEPPFDAIDGVVSTTSGYIGGHQKNPTYRAVSAGRTGHAEAVEVRYDQSRVTYAELLEVFWRNIDPVAKGRQFCDRGSQYRSGIFYHDKEQERLARESRTRLSGTGRFDKPITTEIAQADTFYAAEDYHQDYYLKNPLRYKFYRYRCGRDRRLNQLWGETE